MRGGWQPITRSTPAMIGSSIPASVRIPKKRIAKTNIPAIGPMFCTPCTMNLPVASPKPAASDAATGTTISATSGDNRFVMIRPNSATMATAPIHASMMRLLFSRCASRGMSMRGPA